MRPKQTLPYGSWPSPISIDMAVQGAVALSEPRQDGADIYVLESRPDEAGREALLRITPDGQVTDVMPGLNVRTTVHEYGGGAWAVKDGLVVVTEIVGGRLLLQRSSGDRPVELVSDHGLCFADMEIDAARDRVVAVLEDRRASARQPRNLLCAVSFADGTMVELATGHDFYSDPRLSPDGRHVAFLSWDLPRMPWEGTDLWVAPVEDDGSLGEAVHAAGGPAESVMQPKWAPDGSLVFVSDRTGWWNLYRWRAGASGAAELAPMPAEVGGPQWLFGLSEYDIDDDGAIVAFASGPGGSRLLHLRSGEAPHRVPVDADGLAYVRVRSGVMTAVGASSARPSAVIRLDLASGRSERVREAGTFDVDAGHVSVPRHIEFPSAGGRPAHAWFYPPTNADVQAPPGERPPLVVMSHGGPTSRARTSLNPSRQSFTSRGFAVVDVDYAGSTGYGRPYRDLLHEQWGVVDVEDCASAARWLAEQGLADPARMAIRGGSAGGYTTLAALCFTEVFAAGTSLYGLGDPAALAAVTHKFESQYDRWLIGPLPEAAERFRERAPNHHADRISCPILVLQGADDKVVPPSMAEDIVAALRANGLPHAYLLFEGEGHGFRQAANLRRALEAELSFYAQLFGFQLADDIPPLEIVGLRRGEA